MKSDDLVEILENVVRVISDYSRQKALCEADCRVRDELERARLAVYRFDSAQSRMSTIELNRCKCKLELLQRDIQRFSDEVQSKYKLFINQLKSRIREMRARRRV